MCRWFDAGYKTLEEVEAALKEKMKAKELKDFTKPNSLLNTSILKYGKVNKTTKTIIVLIIPFTIPNIFLNLFLFIIHLLQDILHPF